MSVNVRVPEDLYEKAAAIAKMQNISVDQVFASAFAEHWSAWERLKRRAALGNREDFLAVLDKVPDVEPAPDDRIID
jgi:hypothetical protein